MYEFRTTLPQNDIFIYPIHDTLSMTKIVNATQSQKRNPQGQEAKTTRSMVFGDYTTDIPTGGSVQVTFLDTTLYRGFHAGTDPHEIAGAYRRAQALMRKEITLAVQKGWVLEELNRNRGREGVL